MHQMHFLLGWLINCKVSQFTHGMSNSNTFQRVWPFSGHALHGTIQEGLQRRFRPGSAAHGRLDGKTEQTKIKQTLKLSCSNSNARFARSSTAKLTGGEKTMDIDGSSLLPTLVHVFQSTCQIYGSIIFYICMWFTSLFVPQTSKKPDRQQHPRLAGCEQCLRMLKDQERCAFCPSMGPSFCTAQSHKVL